MPRIFRVLVLLTVAASAGTAVLGACGDKFLLIGHGPRYQRVYASVYPGSILVLAPKTSKPTAINDPQLALSLKQAGHTVQILEDPAKLTQTLSTSPYDIVMANFADAIVIEPQVRQASSKPALVPVMYQPKKAELLAAQKQFSCLLKAPERVTTFLSALDDLMKVRVDAAKGKSK